jgi:hypothetical protein
MRLSIVVAMCTWFACVVEQAINGVEIGIVIIVRPACCANVRRSWHVSNRIECWLVVVFWVTVHHWILMALWDGDLHTHCAQYQWLSERKCERAPCLHVLGFWALWMDICEVDCNSVHLCVECGLNETELSKLWFVYMWWERARMRLSIVVAMCSAFACVVEQAKNGVKIGIVIMVRPACCANVCRSGHVSNRIEC